MQNFFLLLIHFIENCKQTWASHLIELASDSFSDIVFHSSVDMHRPEKHLASDIPATKQ